MGYCIELACSLYDTGGFTRLQGELVEKAEKNDCESHYITYDIESGGGGQIPRNHMIFVFEFPREQTKIIRFIRQVREMKKIHVESLSFQAGKVQLIYASRYYLTIMDKFLARQHRRERSNLLQGPHANIISALRGQ